MTFQYETPNPLNRNHQGKTFVYDVSTKGPDALHAAKDAVGPIINRLDAFRSHLRDRALFACDISDEWKARMIGDDGDSWAVYSMTISSLADRIMDMERELWGIRDACYEQLYG
ncbi:MAG: hypothetical protein LQ346_000619 [Caloplaca aetnensis]|nr:MAG: hypothetical protein LQ346_000619 [Caloplaca aetnensis]